MEHATSLSHVPCPIGSYREYVPCVALRAVVYAFFSFVPGQCELPPGRRLLREIPFHDTTSWSPQFADGHVSMLFELGHRYDEARWTSDSSGLRGTVTGPMSVVGRTRATIVPDMLGIYFRPARVAPLLGVAISELTDHAVDIGGVWGSKGARLTSELAEMDEAGRIDRLESILLARLGRVRPRTSTVDVARLAANVWDRHGKMTVEAMALNGGVSRQHLTRQFHERLGIGPKLYARLARFHSGLVYAGRRAEVEWAQAAVEMGYADQSHLIAEFRQFSGLTPYELASRDWYHPFIERARRSLWSRRVQPAEAI